MSCPTISSSRKFGLKPKFNNNLCFINFPGVLSFIIPATDFIIENKRVRQNYFNIHRYNPKGS